MTDRDYFGPNCGVDSCQREVGHIGDHRHVEEVTPRSIDRGAFGLDDPQSPFIDSDHYCIEADTARAALDALQAAEDAL